MTNKEKKIPDNVVLHPNALPYASDLVAPVIKPDHSLTGWKHGAVHSANKHYTDTVYFKHFFIVNFNDFWFLLK